VDERQRNYQRGNRAEVLAGVYLQLKGYRILRRRYKCPVGEIDLVARRGNLLTFVEVKLRQDMLSAVHSISPHQQLRIINAARNWLACNPAFVDYDISFDAVLLAPFAFPQHIKNAFYEVDRK
jgi:putative endonuclease